MKKLGNGKIRKIHRLIYKEKFLVWTKKNSWKKFRAEIMIFIKIKKNEASTLNAKNKIEFVFYKAGSK